MQDVEICNQALSLIGKSAITSLQDKSNEAKACSIHYDSVRRYVLTAVAWPFARRQVALALIGADAGTPENLEGDGTLSIDKWTYTYMYPSDCLKPILIYPTSAGEVLTPYENVGTAREAENSLVTFVEGNQYVDGQYHRVICTNKSASTLVYVSDVLEARYFPFDFVNVLVHSLATRLCTGFSGDNNLYKIQQGNMMQFLSAAISEYGQEYNTDRKPLVHNPISSFIRARQGVSVQTPYNPYPRTILT
ncbi:putative adaptor protein [Caudoviricetes sp.]|nr:putative adaptor protein [Caudoviricetes sp.]